MKNNNEILKKKTTHLIVSQIQPTPENIWEHAKLDKFANVLLVVSRVSAGLPCLGLVL